MSTPFSIERRVEFGDTDMAGIMHFANFFHFMEAAETAFLRERGLSVTWLEKGQRFGFPRVGASCDYQSPAVFEDKLHIDVNVERVGKKSVGYRFDFSRGTERIAVGRITTVYCRKTADGLESLDIPDDLRKKLEA